MKLHARAGYSNSSKVKRDIEEAAKEVTKYIVDLTNGIWVTPKDARPDSQGNPTAKTKGWRIRDSIEAFIGETMLAKISTGAITFFNDSAKKLMELTTGALRFYDGTDEANPVAEFGAALARIGKTASRRVEVTGSGVDLYSSDNAKTASFGETVVLGEDNKVHTEISGGTFNVIDDEGFAMCSILPTEATITEVVDCGRQKLLSDPIYMSVSNLTSGTVNVGVTTYASGTIYESEKTLSISVPGTAAGASTIRTYNILDGNNSADIRLTLTRLQSGALQLKAERMYPTITSLYLMIRAYYTAKHSVPRMALGNESLAYISGDRITGYKYQGAGYVTNSKTEIHVTLPISKPILSSESDSDATKISVYNVKGKFWQNDKYTHGSAASVFVTADAYDYSLTPGGIRLVIIPDATTNAINNAPIGVDLSCDIEIL